MFMEKRFKMQRIGFILYLLMLVIVAIYSLSFMTSYENLFGFFLKENQGVIDFHKHMLAYNDVLFWFSVVGCVSILFMFILELRAKICDWFALGVMTAFGVVNVASSLYGLLSLPKLMNEYKGVDFTHMQDEDQTLIGVVYNLKFETFYIGYVILGLLLIVTIAFISILWVNRILYKKSEVLDHE